MSWSHVRNSSFHHRTVSARTTPAANFRFQRRQKEDSDFQSSELPLRRPSPRDTAAPRMNPSPDVIQRPPPLPCSATEVVLLIHRHGDAEADAVLGNLSHIHVVCCRFQIVAEFSYPAFSSVPFTSGFLCCTSSSVVDLWSANIRCQLNHLLSSVNFPSSSWKKNKTRRQISSNQRITMGAQVRHKRAQP